MRILGRRRPSVRWFYHQGYNYGEGLGVTEVHGFVLDKPRRIRARLIEHGIGAHQFIAPNPLLERDFGRVHAPSFMALLRDPRSVAEAVEFPEIRELSRELLRRAIVGPQMLAAAGTYACLIAATHGDWVFNLSGGFHHARADLAHGFCLIADVAVALAKARARRLSPRVLILDLDLHQGDGNAVIFADDPDVFTVSMHEEALFPHPKVQSNIDVPLASGTDEVSYLRRLEQLLLELPSEFEPEVVVYIAGTDIFCEDPLGTIRISAEGVLARDRLVARYVSAGRAGLVMLPAGGYTEQSPILTADGMSVMMRYL